MERYLRLSGLAQRAFVRARLERALGLFATAEEEAKRLGDHDLVDRAFCNRCVVLLELDRLGAQVGELKNVLLRSRDPFTAWMAAYYSAQAFEFEGNLKRALAYARRSSELAEQCGEARARKGSANLHGVLALRESHFGEAAEHLRAALALATEDGDDPINLAIARDNIGYCLMCTGAAEEGLHLCRDAAATLESLGSRQVLPEVFEDICFGHLQLGQIGDASRFGEQALALAREFSNPTVEKNTLMLLADAAYDAGEDDVADGYLDLLAVHYPDFAGMKTFLRAFNVREVINLKA
ncbi:MAG: hypothetical protein GW878_03630 [Acidobacteria bacterium]|nr:hypothetical protein [Acidobacteriota bacterium]